MRSRFTGPLGLSLFALSLVVKPTQTLAVKLCDFDIYRPAAMKTELRARLSARGLAWLGPTPAFSILPPGQSPITSSSGVVAGLSSETNVRRGFASLAVLDLENRPLFSLVEETATCPPVFPEGRCQFLRLKTEINEFALEAVLDPDGVLAYYYRFGKPVGRFDFHREVERAMDWLMNTLTTSGVAKNPPLTDPVARLMWALARDADVAPYIGGIKVIRGHDRLRIVGVVPSRYIYSRVLTVARSSGFLYAAPDLVIDTRLLLPWETGPRLGDCRP